MPTLRPGIFLASLLLAIPAARADTLHGEVLLAQPTGAYTYLRLRTAQGDLWAAVPRAPVERGVKVSVFDANEMQDFESRSLGRTFESIWFGVLGVEARDGPAPAEPAAAPQPGRTQR